MRLIDADALHKEGYMLAHMRWDYEPDGLPHAWTELMLLSEAPTIDAVPVVHSWWEISEHNNSLIPCVGYKCHNCGNQYARIDTEKEEYNYCPNCGARMDGRREDWLYESLKRGLEEAIAYENGEIECRTETREDGDARWTNYQNWQK